jgi:hypothetical protein
MTDTTNPQTDREISDPHEVGQAHGCPKECSVHTPGGPDVQTATAPPATYRVNESTAGPDVASAAGQNMVFAVSVPASAPTDRAAIRDRIAEALYRREWPLKQIWAQALAGDRKRYDDLADAVLAVLPAATPLPDAEQAVLRTRIAELESSCRDTDRLRRDWVEMRDRAEALDARVQALAAAVLPAPADRAAILREAADAIESHAWDEGCPGVGCCADTPLAAAALLRRIAAASGSGRVADEAQQPETQADAALRIRVLSEVFGRLTGRQDGDSATNDVPAATVRRVLAEILAGMQPGVLRGADAEQPAAVAQPDGEA